MVFLIEETRSINWVSFELVNQEYETSNGTIQLNSALDFRSLISYDRKYKLSDTAQSRICESC